MFFVYVMYNIRTKKFYIGFTTNIKQRIWQHKSGLNISTKHEHAYWRLVYLEIYLSKEDAMAREYRLKNHGSGLVELKKRIKKSLARFDDKTGAGSSR